MYGNRYVLELVLGNLDKLDFLHEQNAHLFFSDFLIKHG